MKFIPLTQGEVARVDDQDWDWLMEWKWHVRITRKGYKSAVREVGYRPAQTRQVISMASAICEHRGLPPSPLVDHWDGDSLNNQFLNLRPATGAQNVRNTRKQSGTSSFFKGVCWHRGKWQALLQMKNNRLYLGRFCDELEAAKAYDRAALEHFGEFARLNFVD